MHSQERELVPVPTLEGDTSVAHGEEPATAEAQRIAPFQRDDIAGFVERVHNARHVGRREFPLEHCPDGVAPLDRLLRHLMVDGVRMVEISQSVCIGGVEHLDPAFDDLARQHRQEEPSIAVALYLAWRNVPQRTLMFCHLVFKALAWSISMREAGKNYAMSLRPKRILESIRRDSQPRCYISGAVAYFATHDPKCPSPYPALAWNRRGCTIGVVRGLEFGWPRTWPETSERIT